MTQENGKDDGPSILETIHDMWVKGGSKKPSKSDAEKLRSAYSKAHAAKETAKAALKAATAAESDAVKAIVAARGKGPFALDGRNCRPMTRGESAFLRFDAELDLEAL